MNTGEIIADLGINSLVNRINSTGDMAVGTRRESFFSPKEPGVWWTENLWESFEFLSIQEIMDELPGK